jgi:NADPH-dependent 2,4-dienoyl-CoA reductase/sulfur reductase-like enzyme
MRRVDVLVIGAGPAGLAAAAVLRERRVTDVVIAEREEFPGGVLLQCIHPGFGLELWGEELTGPEYAERAASLAVAQGADIMTSAAVLDLHRKDESFEAIILSESQGLVLIEARAVVLATGCRERNRGHLNIPGSRPAGIMTAGLAQRLVNLEGCLPGREIVILGSGDIGLIMARRLSLEGATVKGVIEMKPFPGGLMRNIVQCLHDFRIPLHLSHTVTAIAGDRRLSGVEVTPVSELRERKNPHRFNLTCDALLLSVGLIPESELAVKAGALLDPVTLGPVVDSRHMTSVPGLFACGNSLQVHDVADFASLEARETGEAVIHYLAGVPEPAFIPLRAGNLVRYVLPGRIDPRGEFTVCLRPLAPVEEITLYLRLNHAVVYRQHFRKILPGTMIRISSRDLTLDEAFLKTESAIEAHFEKE